MRTCYQHGDQAGAAHCRRCMMPVCETCLEAEYCPDCAAFARYMTEGQAEPRRPRLIEPPEVRSRTRELMIARLQAQVAESDRLHGARNFRRPVKTRAPMTYGRLMPGVSERLLVRRVPLASLLLTAALAFGFGVFYAQPDRTHAQPARPASAQAIAERPDVPSQALTAVPESIVVPAPEVQAPASGLAPFEEASSPPSEGVVALQPPPDEFELEAQEGPFDPYH